MADQPESLTQRFGRATGNILSDYLGRTQGEEQQAPTQTQEENVEEPEDDTPAGAGYEQSDVGESVGKLQEQVQELSKRFQDSQSHIGRLEAENKAYREILERYSDPAQEQEDTQEVDPLEDPTTLEKYREAYEQDPVGATALMMKEIRNQVSEKVDKTTGNLSQQQEQMQALQRIQLELRQGLADAMRQYGEPAQEIVKEFYDYLQGNAGRSDLADIFMSNRNLVANSDGVKRAVASLVIDRGGSLDQLDQEPTKTRNPQSRPKPSPSQSPTEEEEEDPTRKVAQAIVNAKSPTETLPFM